MKHYNLREVSVLENVTREAIYLRITLRKLQAYKKNGRWYVTEKALQEYIENKWTREKMLKSGERVFDIEKDRVSIKYLSRHFGVSDQRLYYLIRKGWLPYERIEHSYVFNITKIAHLKNMIQGLKKKQQLDKKIA